MRNDAQSMHNYVVSLMNGKGVAKDMERAVEHLEASARLGYGQSLAVLGVRAYGGEGNTTKAVEYWEEGWRRQMDASCAFWLGVMWAEGSYPKRAKSYVRPCFV